MPYKHFQTQQEILKLGCISMQNWIVLLMSTTQSGEILFFCTCTWLVQKVINQCLFTSEHPKKQGNISRV